MKCACGHPATDHEPIGYSIQHREPAPHGWLPDTWVGVGHVIRLNGACLECAKARKYGSAGANCYFFSAQEPQKTLSPKELDDFLNPPWNGAAIVWRMRYEDVLKRLDRLEQNLRPK